MGCSHVYLFIFLNLHCRHCGCCGRATLQHNLSELSSCKSGLIARHRHRRRRRNPLRKAGTGTERHEPDQQLISAKDVPRKSRHVEVRWFWMRELIQRGRVRLEFKEGSIKCADLLTQCLGSQLYLKHRSYIHPHLAYLLYGKCR